MKWMPTTLPCGAKVVQPRLRIARCFALLTIGLKVIDNMKFGENDRGQHLSSSNDVLAAFKAFTVNPASRQLFFRNKMDNTF